MANTSNHGKDHGGAAEKTGPSGLEIRGLEVAYGANRVIKGSI